MDEIIVTKNPASEQLDELGALKWPIWTKEVSTFDWHYDERETCYVLEGQVRVEPDDGRAPVEFGAGDLVVFPAGMGCVWKITAAVRKHYRFG